MADDLVVEGIHAHGYWTSPGDQHHAFDVGLCQALIDLLREEGGSVADLGCGFGRYVNGLRAAGIDCDGYDGNPHTALIPGGHCQVLDLSQPVRLPRGYDWALSLEVAEHLPPAFESSFVRNVHEHNTRGIILSWAVEGQGGHGHFNERNNSYVEALFRGLRYHRDIVTERRLRQQVTDCSWFRNTVMVYRRNCRSVGPAISTREIRWLVNRDDPLILELGAHDGLDSLRFLQEFPGIRLHCFEPDPRPRARFQARDPRCTLHEFAIAAEDGELDFYQSGGPGGGMADWDQSSSIRRPTGHLAAWPWCTFEKTCRIQARSLDSWCQEHPEIEAIDFIWADVQGAEIDVIRGGGRTLRERTRYLYTEWFDTPLYEGQINRNQILELLPDFECIGIYEGCNLLLRNRNLA